MRWIKYSLFTLIFLGSISGYAENGMYVLRRQQMVNDQIKRRGISDENVLRAMGKVKRHLFVPWTLRPVAYNDTPLPIGEDQTISQPYIVAYMTQALRLEPDDRVLEIGTGSGYQAAILAEIVKEVYTVEIIESLGKWAEEALKEMGYENIKVKIADGYNGWKQESPFDAIIVTAASKEISEKLIDQLKPGGRMIAPVGADSQELYLVTKTESGYDKQKMLPVRFVPMVHDVSSAEIE